MNQNMIQVKWKVDQIESSSHDLIFITINVRIRSKNVDQNSQMDQIKNGSSYDLRVLIFGKKN